MTFCLPSTCGVCISILSDVHCPFHLHAFPIPSLFLHRISNSISRGPVVSGQTYVGVEQTQDELEVRLLSGDERHLCGRRRCRGFVGRSLVISFASMLRTSEACRSHFGRPWRRVFRILPRPQSVAGVSETITPLLYFLPCMNENIYCTCKLFDMPFCALDVYAMNKLANNIHQAMPCDETKPAHVFKSV